MEKGARHLNAFPPSPERDKSGVHLESWRKIENKPKQTKACQCFFVCEWGGLRFCLSVSLHRDSRLFIVRASTDYLCFTVFVSYLCFLSSPRMC